MLKHTHHHRSKEKKKGRNLSPPFWAKNKIGLPPRLLSPKTFPLPLQQNLAITGKVSHAMVKPPKEKKEENVDLVPLGLQLSQQGHIAPARTALSRKQMTPLLGNDRISLSIILPARTAAVSEKKVPSLARLSQH